MSKGKQCKVPIKEGQRLDHTTLSHAIAIEIDRGEMLEKTNT
jgi:hypothetical protein